MSDGASGGEHLARAVAIGNRISVRAAATEASYVAELERIVGLAVPHLAPDRPNVIVLAEYLGLPAALVGRAGALARRAHTSRNALTFLALALLPRVLTYRRRWQKISFTRALLLACADALYRPLAETLARLAAQHHAYIIATTPVPRLHRSTDPREIARWGRPGASAVYLPDGPEVYNAALVFAPDGTLIGRVEKVYLTKSEIETLDLTPGRLEDVWVLPTAAGRLGVAISLDAFTPDYLRHLDAQHAEIVIQPDANDMPWAGPGAGYEWQPAEWLNSVLGSIQPQYPHLRYNLCAMQTGNFFDVVFDGQSSITARSDTPPVTANGPDCGRNFVGVDDFVHTASGAQLDGTFLAVAPWVTDDPGIADPDLSLAERRKQLRALGQDLLPGGRHAGKYRESVIWADLHVRSADI
ncbi:MAG TPA: nitrilase-related carbon-nitrogen hydrolase [Ktedonobacterales bacterium]